MTKKAGEIFAGDADKRETSMFSSKIYPLSVLASGILLSGCSLFEPKTQVLTFASEPQGARVTLNGDYAGTTPLRQVVRKNEHYLIEFRKEGYETQSRTTSRTISTMGTLDIVGGVFFLIPLIGLTAPGAWEIDPAGFFVTLTPAQHGADKKPR